MILNIPFILNVVNYDANGNKTTLLNKLSKQIPTDTLDLINDLQEVLNSGLAIDVSSIKTADTSFKNFLNTWNGTGNIAQQYQQHLANASTSTAHFAATLKNIAANALPILAISTIIQLVQAGWDKLNVTVEEQEAKVNSLQAAYQNLQSEYEQLSGKQDLSEAEKKRLSYLERRLELDERILKAEEHQLFEEKTGKKFTDRFDEDNYYTRYQKDTNWNEWGILSGFITPNKNSYGYLSELYSKKMADIKATQEEIDTWTKYRNAVEEGSDDWNVYQSNIDFAQSRQTDAIKKLSENEDQLIINLGDYADVIGDLETQLDSGSLNDEDTKNARELLQLYKARYEYTQLMIDSIQKLNGTYKENLTVLQQIDREYGGGYSDGTAADLNRTQEQKNFRVFSHSLSIDDQEIVNSDAFKQALDQIREKADGAELSVTNYEEALRAAKGTQDALAEGDPVAVNDFNTSVYGLENYAIAKTAAAVAGADLNADINETAALLQAEGLMASDDAQQIMAYMIAKSAAAGQCVSVDSTLYQLSLEYDWLADLIDQWGLYVKAKNGMGNVAGNKNLGVGNYTPAAVASPAPKKKKEDLPNIPAIKPSNAKSAKSETNALSGLNSEMDKLQSSYQSLCDIRDTYNQNGKITVDQYQNDRAALRQNTGRRNHYPASCTVAVCRGRK